MSNNHVYRFVGVLATMLIASLQATAENSISTKVAANAEDKAVYKVQGYSFYVTGDPERLRKSFLTATAEPIVSSSNLDLTKREDGPLPLTAPISLTAKKFHVAGSFGDLTTDGDKILWNGDANSKPDGVRVFGRPSLILPSGMKGSIQFGESEVQYFEKAKDGRFDLRTTKADVGLSMAVTVTEDASPDQLLVYLEYEIGYIASRATEDFNGLAAGKPTIEKIEFVQDFKSAPGTWIMSAVTAPDKQGVLLTMFYVDFAGADGDAR